MSSLNTAKWLSGSLLQLCHIVYLKENSGLFQPGIVPINVTIVDLYGSC